MAASMIPANSQMPVGLIMFLMSLLAIYGLRKVHSTPPSSEMPLAV
jgi:DHA1 family 2-module integral membrane pump EmrD-like MFS transporter